MRDLLGRILHAMVRNPHYKLLSAIIALSAWLWVQGTEVKPASLPAEVRWEMPPGLVATEELPTSVLLSIRGSINALRHAEETSVALVVDLSEVEAPGPQTVDLARYKPTEMPPNIELVGVTPPVVQLVLDTRVTRKVDVRPVTVGEPDPGYRVEQVTVEPMVVEVAGPRVAIDDLFGLDTEPVDLSGLRHNQRFQQGLVYPRTLEVIGGREVQVSVTVEPRLSRKKVSAVPVYVWRRPLWRADVGDDGVVVELEGPTAALRDLDVTDVMVVVTLPDNPKRSRYAASLDGSSGLRAEVMVHGQAEVIATSLQPQVIEVFTP